jgi:hypothetical protein
LKASAEKIAAAMKRDFSAWQGSNARRDNVRNFRAKVT